MSFLPVLVTIFGSLMAVSNFPQAYKIWKRKSAKDVSGIMWTVYSIGSCIWLIYGITILDKPLVIANAIGAISACTVLGMWNYYPNIKIF